MSAPKLQKYTVDKNERFSLSDFELAQTALEDSDTEEALLRRLYPKILHVAWSIVGNRWMADEVAQVAAVQVLKSLDSFSGVGSLESWAGRITCRVSMRMLKSERKAKVLLPLECAEKVSSNESVDNALWRRKLFEKLICKMETIPQRRRIPLQLHLIYGYTVPEVAEITNSSPNTVKDRLRTAYNELRTIMDENPTLRAAMLEVIS